MRQIVLPILGLLITFLSAQAHAIHIEWDKCAGYKEARAYKECRVYYGYTSSGEEKGVQTLLCRQVDTINFYQIDVKKFGEVIQVRSAAGYPWRTSHAIIELAENGARIGHAGANGENVLDATCSNKK